MSDTLCPYCGEAVDPYDLYGKVIKASNDGSGVQTLHFHRKCLEAMPKPEFDRWWVR